MNFFRSKRIMIIMISIISLFFLSSVYAGNIEKDFESGVEDISMRIYEIDGREMFQLRDLAESKGWTLAYLEERKEVVIRGNDKFVRLSLNGASDKPVTLAESPKLIEGRTYLAINSLRTLLDELNESIDYISSLYTEKSYYSMSELINAHIRFYNLSDEAINLSFGSGQRYDLTLEKEGLEVWRWSNDKFFTMALADIEVAPGKSLDYNVEIDYEFEDIGEYILTANLATINTPIKFNEVELVIEK
ncbi:BsuPI-related putative proteinase inhibitor [Natronospora cellulosivora (SeqCode)]